MKEMNKCFSFHQSQPSTSHWRRHCTVRGRHFPSISPLASADFHRSRLLKNPPLSCPESTVWCFLYQVETACSVKSISALRSTHTKSQEAGKKKWMSRHFKSCSHSLNNDGMRNVCLAQLDTKRA